MDIIVVVYAVVAGMIGAGVYEAYMRLVNVERNIHTMFLTIGSWVTIGIAAYMVFN